MLTEELFRRRRIMVIAAHPDDELLGVGATMHKVIRASESTVHVVILGEGLTSRSIERDPEKWEEELRMHRNNIKEAQQFIGYNSLSIYDFPDNRFDSVDILDIIKVIEKEKNSFLPDIIFTHHAGDLNIDHQITFKAVMTACRPMKDEGVRTIITFETPSATEWNSPLDPRTFSPNLFVEVTEEDVNSKISGMEKYQFEKRVYPHPRSPLALKVRAQYWGVATGVEYAEAFCLIRHISS